MTKIDLQGIHRVAKTLASGEVRFYYYAWRGGPRLHAKPGTPEFAREYQDAAKRDDIPKARNLHRLIVEYRSSAEYKDLSASARREYARYLDMIDDKFGTAPLAAFDDRRIRRKIRTWRDSMADRPRTADYALATLHRLLAFGVEGGTLRGNAATGFKDLHKSDRSKIIWEPGEIAAFCQYATPATARGLHLARLTGLRREDLVSITWSADKGSHLEWKTGKSRGRRTVIVPITRELRGVLDAMPRGSATTILTGERGKPYTPDGFSTNFMKAKKAAGVDKRLHDLRGNAATALCVAGLDDRAVAEIVGWSEKQVAAIRRRYVDRERIVRAAVHQLERTNTDQ